MLPQRGTSGDNKDRGRFCVLYGTNGDVILMDFLDIDWADSDLESINIQYDRATLTI